VIWNRNTDGTDMSHIGEKSLLCSMDGDDNTSMANEASTINERSY